MASIKRGVSNGRGSGNKPNTASNLGGKLININYRSDEKMEEKERRERRIKEEWLLYKVFFNA